MIFKKWSRSGPEEKRLRTEQDKFDPYWAKSWYESPDTWAHEFTPRFYYENMRKEIEREDGITNQRVTWAMSLHGFLIASMTLLLSGAWPLPDSTSAQPENWGLRLLLFRELALGGIGLIGIGVAFISYRGVRASRISIHRIKQDWSEYNEVLRIVPSMAPQSFGHGPSFPSGSTYAKLIPGIFVLLWGAYLIAYLLVLGPLICEPIRVVLSYWICLFGNWLS